MTQPTMHIFRTALVALAWVTFAGCSSEPEPADVLVSPQSKAYLEEGSRALDAYRFDLALAAADNALRRQPRLADAYFLKGRTYSEMVKLEEAESAYRKVLELNPEYRGVWHNLGNMASRQNEYRKAIDYYGKEARMHPAPAPWQSMGKAYRELGVVDSAMYAYERSLSVDSSYTRTYVDIAQLLDDEGEYERALGYAKRAHDLSPSSLEVRYMLGSLLMKTGSPEKALPHLQAVAEEWPWHHSTFYSLGQALARMGRQDEAMSYLEKSEELRALQAQIEQAKMTVSNSPSDPYAHAQLGALLRRSGQYGEALHAYRVALHLSPENPEFMNNLAVLQLLRGESEQAAATLRRVLEKNPENVEGWLNLGIIYVKSGNEAQARKAWQAALRYDPNNEAAQAYLARLGSS